MFTKVAFEPWLLSLYDDVFIMAWCQSRRDFELKHSKYLLNHGEGQG
jgi:hypothetical protein